MYAMQYGFILPADYDMKGLAVKVEAAVHLTDDYPGLGLKAYLFRERGTDGAAANEYTSFYLWNEVAGMNRFLWGDGPFHRIVSFLGRPAVQHWTGVASVAGPARGTAPKAASRRLTSLPVDPDPTGAGLAERIAAEIDELQALSRRDGVHTAALALDPQSWQLVRFVLWRDTAAGDEDATERYEVLHLSEPGLAELPDGRAW